MRALTESRATRTTQVALLGLTATIASFGTACVPSVRSPIPPASEVRPERFHSGALGASKAYTVYLPAAYAADPARRFPVVYLLHGYFGNETSWIVRGQVSAVADSAFAAGVAPMILVMPDGDQSFWVDWDRSPGVPCDAAAALGEPVAEACVPASRYGTYVARDLVAEVDSRFRTIARRSGRAIAGISAGGTGALVLAFISPDVFSAVASFSAVAVPLSMDDGPCGAPVREARTMDDLETALERPLPNWRLRWGSDTAEWWQRDPARAARRLAASGARAPAIRLETGDADPLAAETCALAAMLDSLGFDPGLSVGPGRHDWTFWRARLGAGLAWLASETLPANPPEASMDLGAFSVSLTVRDIAASRRFYEKLGFTAFAGDQSQNWLILKNGEHVIGLFQGMFERNILTFNPGWDQNAQPVAEFTDIRKLQRRLRESGVQPTTEVDEATTGPGSFTVVDPDGNTILFDQHR